MFICMLGAVSLWFENSCLDLGFRCFLKWRNFCPPSSKSVERSCLFSGEYLLQEEKSRPKHDFSSGFEWLGKMLVLDLTLESAFQHLFIWLKIIKHLPYIWHCTWYWFVRKENEVPAPGEIPDKLQSKIFTLEIAGAWLPSNKGYSEYGFFMRNPGSPGACNRACVCMYV